MSNILVIAEYQDGKIKKTTFELISKAKALSEALGGQVVGLLVGGAGVADMAEQLAPYGASRVAVAEHTHLALYNTLAYAEAVFQAMMQLKPSVVLSTASPLGKDLMPRVASKLKAGFAADCIDLRIEGKKLVAKKPIYSGKVFCEVVYQSEVQMASTRPNSFLTSTPDQTRSAEILKVDITLKDLRAPMKEKVQGMVGKADLTEAEIIVSGGRAMGNADNFKTLHELGDVLGATVGASRAAVDSGFASHDMQVGQTGKVVNPKLYIACGISGAIQHLAGMRTSKVIVAINKDPEAPIFSKADYGIVGDLFTVVPLLTQEFKKILAE